MSNDSDVKSKQTWTNVIILNVDDIEPFRPMMWKQNGIQRDIQFDK